MPFTFHWYDGATPPCTGVALKVTGNPGQKGFVGVTIEIPAGRFGFTFIVIVLLVAGFPAGQFAFEVKTQVTISPFTGIYE